MKKIFLIFIVSVLVLLTACSTAASTSTRSSRRTPVAQIPAQSTSQPLTTAQPTVDAPTSTSIPATVTPLSTSDALATPTSTADPSLPADLDVISRQGYAMFDGFYIVGELLNNTSTPMGNIKITATYYYLRAGKPVEIGTQDGTTLLDVIPAYGMAPFVIGPYVLTTNKGGPVNTYDLHEVGHSATLPRQDLVVQTGANSYSAGTWLYVRGEILNKGTTDAKFVKVAITLYDPDGNVIAAISTYTSPSTVPAGGDAPFTASTEYWPNFDHFTVQVQGQ
ncbi:MAG: FxLYD domain-containing protein [Anaerolineales bacterium]